MKSNITPSRHLWFLSLLLIHFIAKSISAEVITKRQDNIVIAVESTIDPSGETHFSCKLSNQSPHTLASAYTGGEGNSFYIKLLDQYNNLIPQDPEWANNYGQKGSRLHDRPRFCNSKDIDSGEETTFEFNLEDAYPKSSFLGRKIVISWESDYYVTTTTGKGYLDEKGQQMPGREENYMFPPRWDISVTQPLGIAGKNRLAPLKVDAPTLHSTPGPSSKTDPSSTLPLAFASAAASERQDDVVISATITADPSGKHPVSCTLSNLSANIIAAYLYWPTQTNGVFYIKLLDQQGNIIPQDQTWADNHSQKGSMNPRDSRSKFTQQINPGGKTQFDFNLEDAYLDKAALGKELIISWESIYYLPTIQANEHIDSKGNTVPAKEESYKFLSHWEISTSLPLVAVTEKPAFNPPAGQIPVNPTSQNAVPNKLELTAKNSTNLSHRGWWLLLLIPASLIAYRLTRQS